MKKLEQCVRLAHAIDPEALVRHDEGHTHLSDKPLFFATAYSAPPNEKNEIAAGRGATLEEAVEALHLELQQAVQRMRLAVDAFDDATAEGTPQ